MPSKSQTGKQSIKLIYNLNQTDWRLGRNDLGPIYWNYNFIFMSITSAIFAQS